MSEECTCEPACDFWAVAGGRMCVYILSCIKSQSCHEAMKKKPFVVIFVLYLAHHCGYASASQNRLGLETPPLRIQGPSLYLPL